MIELTNKVCYKCLLCLPITMFSKYKASKDGFKTNCKNCVKAYRLANIEAILQRDKLYRDNNRQRISEYNTEYRLKFPERVAAKDAKRRSQKLKACPAWLTNKDKQDIKDLYKQSNLISKQTGIKHHVDHIVPLNSNIVCGLHVPWNLQILPANENIRKSNKILE